MNLSENGTFRVGEWRIEPALDEISRNGKTIKLEPRAMQVLVCLARRPGEVVRVDDLLDGVWKDVVVTQDSVYQAVASLRRALGDDPKDPSYIANVLRRGYRLVAPVNPSALPPAVDQSMDVSTDVPVLPPQSATGSARARHARWLAIGLGIALTLAAGLFVSFKYLHHQLPEKTMLVVLPFQNMSGDPGQDYFADGMSEELIARS